MQQQPLQPENHINLSAPRAYEIVRIVLNAQSPSLQSLNFSLRNDDSNPEVLASLLRTAIRVVLANESTYCSAGGYISTGPHQLRKSLAKTEVQALETGLLEAQTTSPPTISAERLRALNRPWGATFRANETGATLTALLARAEIQDRLEREALPPVYM